MSLWLCKWEEIAFPSQRNSFRFATLRYMGHGLYQCSNSFVGDSFNGTKRRASLLIVSTAETSSTAKAQHIYAKQYVKRNIIVLHCSVNIDGNNLLFALLFSCTPLHQRVSIQAMISTDSEKASMQDVKLAIPIAKEAQVEASVPERLRVSLHKGPSRLHPGGSPAQSHLMTSPERFGGLLGH